MGPEKIDHITDKTIYQILLWKGVGGGHEELISNEKDNLAQEMKRTP